MEKTENPGVEESVGFWEILNYIKLFGGAVEKAASHVIENGKKDN